MVSVLVCLLKAVVRFFPLVVLRVVSVCVSNQRRNAAKRRMRALCADFGGSISGLDIVFLAKRRILQLPYQKLQNEGMKIVRSLRKEEAQRNEQEA